MPEDILQLLITNDSYRKVALNSYEKEHASSIKAAKYKGVRNEAIRQAATAPGRLRTDAPNTDDKTDLKRGNWAIKTSIRGMLPTMMNMYEEQHSINYRSSCKKEFVPYSVLNGTLRTMTPANSMRMSRNTLSTLPDLSRLNRLSEPKFTRMSRSTSVQLPQMHSWSMLRKKLGGSFIQEL